ncbi:MAG: hypothetical protein GX876_12460 [Bacteroidales bacterium]|nr:hypothetical protein [Bacteroidales bacterium]
MSSLGEKVILEKIEGGVGLNNRLSSLGLTPGTELCIIQDTGGPLLVSVRDSRIALGRGVAHKIMVSHKF